MSDYIKLEDEAYYSSDSVQIETKRPNKRLKLDNDSKAKSQISDNAISDNLEQELEDEIKILDKIEIEGSNIVQENHNTDFFRKLPDDIILKIFSCLSAADLFNLSKTSKNLRLYSDDEGLWRRHYVHRFGDVINNKKKGMRWKILYLDQDADDCERIIETSPLVMSHLFLEMQKAQRNHYLTLCSVNEIRQISSNKPVIPEIIMKYIKEHDLPSPIEQKPDNINQSGPFIEFGDCYLCQKTGWIHICDSYCEEKIISADKCGWVCPISGRSGFFTMREKELYDVLNESSSDSDCDEDTGNYLQKAFVIGYNCENEEELKKAFG